MRTLRRAAGLTQAELAERAALSIRGLSDLERGINRSPRRETLMALADTFGLADEDRQRFFAAARRRPPLAPSVSGSLPASTPSQPDAEPAGQANPAGDIQVFFIADVRGYSTYTSEHRDEEAAQLTLRFATLANAAVQVHGGQVLEVRGDEVLAVFSSARAALRAAILLQEQAGHASASTPEQSLRCGIGVEAGEAVAVPGGYRGQAINLAARLCARAAAGEVLAGETVIGLARKVEGLVFLDRNLATLKGIAVPVRITQVVAAQVPTNDLDERREEQAGPAASPQRLVAVGNFLSAQPRHPLVAREAEMAVLLSALDTVHAGTGQLVLLVGEPGVGKTRLAQEILQAARDRGWWGITGRCYAPQATVPYYPFLEALSRAYDAAPLALRAAVPLQWSEVARLIPNQRLDTPASSGLHAPGGDVEEQQRLFWQVTGFLQALADERPLAVLVDDLHWADSASLELLLHLARQTYDHPILLLGTYRESEVPWDHPLSVGIRDLIRAQLVERLELGQFTREGTAALLATSLEGGEVSKAVTDLIYGSTEGNAFFVQELLRTLLERGDIVQWGNGRWEPREGAARAVPTTVQAAVLERVARLSASAQETLELASVLGQQWSFDDLLATGSRIGQTPGVLADGASEAEAETQLEEVLEEAVGARVLREVSSSGYAFSHALAQQALYEQLSARRRHRLHRAVAQCLERLGEVGRTRRAADIAYHFGQAEEPAHALPYLLQAGEQALSVYALTDAERQFRTALELAQQLGDGELVATALERLGYTLMKQARIDEAYAVLEPAADEAERRGDLPHLVRLEWLLTDANGERRGTAQWAARLLRLIETARAEGALPEIVRLYSTLAGWYWGTSQYAELLHAAEGGLQVARALGEARLIADARGLRGVALACAGQLEEGLLELEAAVLPEVVDLEEINIQQFTLNGLGWVLLLLGRTGEALAQTERALAVVEPTGSPDEIAWAAANSSFIAFVRGDWAAAHRYLDRGLAMRPRLGSSYWSDGTLYMVEGQLQLAQGQLEAAIHSAETGLAVLQRLTGNLEWLREAQQLLAEIDLVKGDPAAARDRLLPLLDHAELEETDVNPLLPLVSWADLELGEVEAADGLARQTVARLRAQHDRFHLVEALRVAAAVRIRQERWDGAEAALEEALTLARAMSYPYAEAKLLATYGDLMVATGQQARAREQYEAALSILRPLAEVPYTERIQRALAEMSQR